jgi:hypothetical protein
MFVLSSINDLSCSHFGSRCWVVQDILQFLCLVSSLTGTSWGMQDILEEDGSSITTTEHETTPTDVDTELDTVSDHTNDNFKGKVGGQDEGEGMGTPHLDDGTLPPTSAASGPATGGRPCLGDDGCVDTLMGIWENQETYDSQSTDNNDTHWVAIPVRGDSQASTTITANPATGGQHQQTEAEAMRLEHRQKLFEDDVQAALDRLSHHIWLKASSLACSMRGPPFKAIAEYAFANISLMMQPPGYSYFKIGVTEAIGPRFMGARIGYIKDGFTEMHILYAHTTGLLSDPDSTGNMEIELIDLSRHIQGCLNVAKGGQGVTDGCPNYTYVVYMI